MKLYIISSTFKHSSSTLRERGKDMIYTNLDTNDMIKEIEKHLENVCNKDYIKGVINASYKYELINDEEKEYLYRKYEV